VLATIVFHHSIHLASVIPVIPGVVGTLIFALVHAGAAAAAVLASGASLIGTGRVRIGGPSVKPASA
jgi:hypothetical protein